MEDVNPSIEAINFSFLVIIMSFLKIINYMNNDEYKTKYQSIVIYGAGDYYFRNRKEIIDKIQPDFICDRKFETDDIKQKDGIKVIPYKELIGLKECLVVITIEKSWLIRELTTNFTNEGIDCIHVSKILNRPIRRILPGDYLKSNYPEGSYSDEFGNQILFDETLSDTFHIELMGSNNHVTVGNNVLVGSRCYVRCGENGVFAIGNNTEIWDAVVCVSNSKVSIGKDCLLSRQVEIRSHDSHHIFSAETGERLNPAENIIIGDQCWIGKGAVLLGGAEIGKGSVVGTRCVTSDKFEERVVVAGVPGKIIRKGILWSRDDTDHYDHKFFSECFDQTAMKYFDK